MPKDILIKVFKAGKHPDSAVPDKEFTPEYLTTLADNYNNQSEDKRHDAPLIPDDHSKTFVDKNGKVVKKPAFGWVKSLVAKGNELFANILPTPSLVEGVKNNYYKKVSIGIKNDNLDHIAILGAVNPAVKGLGMLELSEAGEIMFSEDMQEELKTFSNKYPEFEIEFAEADNNSTLKQLLEAQAERSKKYAISVKENKNMAKPEYYSDLTDDDFGDPVHYYYPLNDKPNVISSIQQFNNYDERNSYNSTERQIIASRIISAGLKFKLDMLPERIFFSDKDNNLHIINQFGENSMPFKEFMAAVIKDFTAASNEETATKLQPILSKHQGLLDATPAPAPSDEKKFTETPEYIAQQKEIEALKAENRRNKNKEFVEKGTHLIGVEKALALDALEVAHQFDEANKETKFEFAEGNETKKLSAVELTQNLLKKFPDRKTKETVDFAVPDNYDKELDEVIAIFEGRAK